VNSNSISNVVSYTITDEARQASDTATEALMTQLKPTLLSLNDGDRRALPRIGAKHEVLITKALHYARTNPELLPGFIDVEEYQRDVDALQILTPYRQALGQLLQMLDDTIDQARSEGYAAGLAAYQMSKTGAKLNQPGAMAVRDDLAACFANYGRRAKVTTPPPAPSPAPASAPAV